MAIITPALGAARTSLNRRFPNRDKASDGWIGDQAHRGTRSGHNPDETGNAEYQDSDSLDEVRAVDLDKDLRHPGLTMHDVVRAILAEPRDRDRCSYLIYDRTIWSRSAGYRPRAYTGSNPHTSHLHISGRPTNDADDRPWLSIERLGNEEDDMDLGDKVAIPKWIQDKWPDEGLKDGSITVRTALGSGYGHSRSGKDETYRQTPILKAILAAVAGEDVAEAVRAELDAAAARERAERAAELAELHARLGGLSAVLLAELGPALAESLGEAAADLPADAVEAAVGRALARTSLIVDES